MQPDWLTSFNTMSLRLTCGVASVRIFFSFLRFSPRILSFFSLSLPPSFLSLSLSSVLKFFRFQSCWIRNCGHRAKSVNIRTHINKSMPSLRIHCCSSHVVYLHKHLRRIKWSVQGSKVIELRKMIQYLVNSIRMAEGRYGRHIFMSMGVGRK